MRARNSSAKLVAKQQARPGKSQALLLHRLLANKVLTIHELQTPKPDILTSGI